MELLRSTSHRGFSVRGILVFVLTVIVAALLWATVSPAPTQALEQEGPPAASWKGESILYAGHQYIQQPDALKNNSLGLPEGTHYFLYAPAVETGKYTVTAYVISFKPGTDPPEETKASYASYTYDPQVKHFSNPADKQIIDITKEGDQNSYSSCTVEGIGWIICPVAVFMADSMDNIFDLVSGFFTVQPVTMTNQNSSVGAPSSLYTAWNVMRSIANVAFIIAFIIIIYSQLTSVGITNYGIKKLLPRIIVAALLVNLSYIICSVAVDISNILGFSLQNIFIQIRQDTFAITNDSWDASTVSWTSLTTFILSGGAIGVIGVAAAGQIGGALYALLPILVGVILTILVVLLILAARQAIIVILIVIAPLAFVAYLLPNTEKWFKQWRDLFMTMLIFFPAFSLVFGGSQLAGGLILQNPSSVFMIIFGLAVQVAPLVITPLLLRLSGGLLGKIAGIINDPRKGLLDRTKNWSNERAEMRRQQSLKRTGTINPFRSIAQKLDNNNRRVKERTELYKAENDNRYHETAGHAQLHTAKHSADLDKERIENSLKTHTQSAINTRGSYLNVQSIEVENAKVMLEKQTEATNAMNAEYRSGLYDTGGNERLARLQSTMAATVIETAAQKQRQGAAQYEQQRAISTRLSDDNDGLLTIAQGVGGNSARIRARSTALAALNKLEAEALENNVKLIADVALSQGQTLKQYSASVVQQVAASGLGTYSETDFAAAVQAQINEKNMTLMEVVRGSTHVNQELINKLIVNNAGTFKEAGGYHMQDDLTLNINSFGGDVEKYNKAVAAKRVETLGNVASTDLSKLKYGWVASFAGDKNDNVQLYENVNNANPADLRKAYTNLKDALTNPDTLALLGDRQDKIRRIEAAMAYKLGLQPTPDTRDPAARPGPNDPDRIDGPNEPIRSRPR